MEDRVESVICVRQESWLESRQVHCWLERHYCWPDSGSLL